MTKAKTAPGQRGKVRTTTSSQTASKPPPDVVAGTAKANPNELRVVEKAGQSHNAIMAEFATTPIVRAAKTTQDYSRALLGELDLTDCVIALRTQIDAVHGGDMKNPEATLIAHAATLDAVFHALARRAILNFGEYLDAGERYLRLALKAQSQCRATLETLALLKNPAPVAFVRQANIAHGPQQVNNASTAADPSRARETENGPNQLLEAQHGERLDTGTTGTASAANSQLATVGEINRPKDRNR